MSTVDGAASGKAAAPIESPRWLGLGITLVLGFTTLGLAIWDEPLHIDELRQVGYYTRSLSGIAEGAVSQTQPPLDYWVGALVQNLLWPSEAVWRLPGFGLALLGLTLAGLLLIESRVLAWSVVGLIALTPAFLEFSSYARPYALPYFLMMAASWGFEGWRREGRIPSLAAGGIAVLALPLSRTTEPTMFLFLTIVALVAIRLIQGKDDGKWIWPPAVLTVVGLAGSIAVLPVVQTTRFRVEGDLNTPSLILSRLWSEIIPVHIAQAPLGIIGFVTGLAGLLIASWLVLRRKEVALWWILPISFTALAIPVVFAAMSVPGQPYFERYAYFTVPALALGLGVCLSFVRQAQLASVIGIAVLLVASTAAVSSLTDVHRPDFKRLSEVARPLVEGGNVVLYEENATISGFRSGAFPGVPTYIPRSHAVIATELAAREELLVEPGRRPLILVQGLSDDIEGWFRIMLDDQFHVLVPERSTAEWSPHQQAESLWLACESLSPDTGSYLCVTAIAILVQNGLATEAKAYAEMTLDRIDDLVVGQRVAGYIGDISADLIP